MAFSDTLVVILIIFLIFFVIYTRVKNQELKDTYEELKEIIIKEK